MTENEEHWDDLFDQPTPDEGADGNNDPDKDLDEAGGDNDNPDKSDSEDPDKSKEDPNKGEEDKADDEKDPDKDDKVDKPDVDTSNVNLTGIEKYLANFDIEGGVIAFDDGTTAQFSELDPDKQAEILTELHDKNAKSIEDKFGLDEGEIGLINYLRTNNMTVDDYIENLAKDRVNTLLAATQSQAENFKDMDSDAIYVKFLKQNNPDITAEQLDEDLGKAKELNTYNNIVENLRTKYIDDQEKAAKNAIDLEEQNFNKTLEDQRQEVVQVVSEIDNVAGITLNDDAKNSLLDQILQVNESGDPLFMEEVFSNPKDLFNAAFWYYYGPGVLEQREQFWKEEKSKAYKRGKEDALGKPSPHINFSGKDTTGASDDEEDDWITLNT